MKPSLYRYRFAHPLLALGLVLTVPASHADTTFSGLATLTFSLNSITNLNPAHPNDLSGLEVFGSFQQATDPSYFYVVTSGDGSVVAVNPSVSVPVAVGSDFSHSFQVSGSAHDGTVDSYHTGWFSLDFNNTGGDSYLIDVSLSYQLDSVADGLFANSSVSLAYGYTGNAFDGTDSVGAGTFDGLPLDAQSKSASTGLIFTLAAGESPQTFFADAVITGNLQAAPVPVPAAVWCFGSGLLGIMGIGIKKRNHAKV